MTSKEISRLAKIEVNQNQEANPFDLFQNWFQTVKTDNCPFSVRVMNIATVSKEGVVSNRSVIALEVDEEGILFSTTKKSRKHSDIQSHPQVSVCFVWRTVVDDKVLSRQVRMEGIANEMDIEYTRGRFRSASFRTQLRLAICKQGNEIAWDDLKKRHEAFLAEHADKQLEFPSESVHYKIIPYRMEFYESYIDPITIADRVLFRKNEENEWYHVHLEA